MPFTGLHSDARILRSRCKKKLTPADMGLSDHRFRMLLHVIWGIVEEKPHQCPTFSVSGVMLKWADRTPAHVRQGRFEWRDEAWEASIEISGTRSTQHHTRGVLRLHPDVMQSWAARSLNPRKEAARQLDAAFQQRGWTGHLGVVTLAE
jgi:hypothetical protein